MAQAAKLPVSIGHIRRQLDRQARQLAARFAPKRFEEPPAWAVRDDPPRPLFAALADPHFDDTGRRPWTRPTRKRLLAVCRFLNQRIRPDATLILGDLIAHEQPEQLRRVKALLDEHLDSPILPVHPDRILILTYEEADGAYRQAPIYQKIDIPAALRLPAGHGRAAPAAGGGQADSVDEQGDGA